MSREIISVLVVDDEPEARDLLTMLLEPIHGVRVVGQAENADSALLQVIEKKPDLILLDIQMPDKSGFDLVKNLRQLGLDTGYIFITAYDVYAIQAVRASAFDYLLKPADPGELVHALDRFRKEKYHKKLEDRVDQLFEHIAAGRRLKLNTRTGFLVINPAEIIYCEADGNYTEIVLANQRKEVISSNLGNVEKELSGDGFFRISRSSLINLRYLTHVDNKKGICRLRGDGIIELKVARKRLGMLEGIIG